MCFAPCEISTNVDPQSPFASENLTVHGFRILRCIRNRREKSSLLTGPSLAHGAPLRATEGFYAFTNRIPMTKTGSTWIRCVASAAAVDPRAVRGRAPPSVAGARIGTRFGVPAHRLLPAVPA